MKVIYETDFPITDDACAAATGKSIQEWFAVLDAFGGPSKGRRALGNHLYADLKVDIWWVQTLNSQYEIQHGIREKDGRLKGYCICSTKTISAPLDVVYAAWATTERLDTWFSQGSTGAVEAGSEFSNADGNRGVYKRVRENKDIRFEWRGETGDLSIVDVAFSDKGKGKTGVLVTHDRIQSREEADGVRRAWAEALTRLKGLAEAA